MSENTYADRKKSRAKTVIRVKNLIKHFDGGVQAVRGVTFDVFDREVVVIIGSSGSGKSTVLRCINKLIDPTDGEIYLEDIMVNSSQYPVGIILKGVKQTNITLNIRVIIK